MLITQRTLYGGLAHVGLGILWLTRGGQVIKRAGGQEREINKELLKYELEKNPETQLL